MCTVLRSDTTYPDKKENATEVALIVNVPPFKDLKILTDNSECFPSFWLIKYQVSGLLLPTLQTLPL